jgi:cytochrome c-type biogenesis protein
VLQRLGGVITIAVGRVFLGAFLMLQRGIKMRHAPATVGRAPCWVLLSKGLGWTRCLGASVIALASPGRPDHLGGACS